MFQTIKNAYNILALVIAVCALAAPLFAIGGAVCVVGSAIVFVTVCVSWNIKHQNLRVVTVLITALIGVVMISGFVACKILPSTIDTLASGAVDARHHLAFDDDAIVASKAGATSRAENPDTLMVGSALPRGSDRLVLYSSKIVWGDAAEKQYGQMRIVALVMVIASVCLIVLVQFAGNLGSGLSISEPAKLAGGTTSVTQL